MFRCPKCGAELNIALVAVQTKDNNAADNSDKATPAPKGRLATFEIDRKRYTLSDQEVFEAAADLKYPETIRRYYVELPNDTGGTRRFPIKQVVRQALETKYPNKFTERYFTAHRARDILMKLGIPVKMIY